MFVTTPLRSVQRIISLPITHVGGRQSTSNTLASQKTPPKVLTYYHFQVHLPHRKAEQEKQNDNLSRLNPRYWVTFAQTKAAQTWSGFGNAPEGSWKLRVFRGGEALVDRIDFEELALKGVDPSLGPTILRPDFSRKDEKAKDYKISLLFPPSVHTGEASLSYLRSLVQMHTPRHKRGFWIWLLVSPFTAPFMIIPVIPNLPFFFCIWRSWSHYRAYRASEYLKALIEHGQVIPEASPILDAIYKDFAPKPIESSSSSASSPASSSKRESEDSPLLNHETDTPRLLLTREAVPAIISACNLKESASTDLYRALEQAKQRLASEYPSSNSSS
ncbi:hypothetical protein D9758_002499 [Tetrapyrgos nigripes]|uniref:Mitochondrial K+-H+ exchange-related-domain-containing protein n=1 Tax=Tetrapyrgos nigripes TaxID=182062 RepID=A0A8H5GRI2_9AGAR|nr:hypothetical protein D9758_002499 [Tetrapyrgos nigripes]